MSVKMAWKEVMTPLPQRFASSLATNLPKLPSSSPRVSAFSSLSSEAQLKYLFTDFLFRNICSVCVCTPQDLAAMAGQLTSDQVNAIQYAARVMGVHLGTDPSYQHPYGLFVVGDNLARVFNAVVGKDNASAIKALESCFALQACIEGFSDKIPATVDELTRYVSTFFGDPALFRDLYRMHCKNTPPLKLETGAADCKSSQ